MIDYGVRIVLSEAQMKQAITLGVRRLLATIQRGQKTRPNLEGRLDRWGLHIEGAGGELAASITIGVPWDPPDPGLHGLPDVAGYYEVKTSVTGPDLLIPSNEAGYAEIDPQAPYILVIGSMPVYQVRGWVYGWEAMQYPPRVLVPGKNPVHKVPQRDLHSIAAIPRPEGVSS